MSGLWPFITGYYLAINLFLLLLFYGDKRRARLGRRRISEETLLSLGLLGGMVGGLLGRPLFHHKTRKRYFGVVYWLAFCLHLGLWYFIWHLNSNA